LWLFRTAIIYEYICYGEDNAYITVRRYGAKVYRIEKKTLYAGSGSFKVIEFVTNRKDICDFLLVVNSNFGSVTHGFGPIGQFIGKNSPLEYYPFVVI